MIKLSKEYWDSNYKNLQIGWDIGAVSLPLKTYFDQITDKSIRVLIPGAGNAYEAEYLWNLGFRNVFVLDFSVEATESFSSRFPNFPKEQIFNADFFQHQGEYDLIVEQTFFTSIHPLQREDYALKMAALLKPKAKLMGLLFSHEFSFDGPPYGGTEAEYKSLFSPYFEFKIFEKANNSIKPRKDRELFFVLEKK